MAKEENKKKLDKSQLAIKVMALVLAGMMVLAFAGTLIFYLVAR